MNHMRANESKVRDAHIEQHKRAMYLLRKYESVLGEASPQSEIAMPSPNANPSEQAPGSETEKANTPDTFNATK